MSKRKLFEPGWREKQQQYDRKKYKKIKKDPELYGEHLERVRRWREGNLDRWRAISRKSMKKLRQEKPHLVKKTNKRYYEKNKEAILMYHQLLWLEENY